MTRPLFSKSVRKHIRFQKAHIRRGVFDFKKQQELIQELYQRFALKPEKKEEKSRKITPKKKQELAAVAKGK